MGRKFHQKITGLYIVNKPIGISSMGVVKRVRWCAEGNKTGHAGTLDPLASGVLVCCLGKATKLVESLMGTTKVYETCIDLSAFTVTDDAEAEREEVEVAEIPSREAIEAVLVPLTGEIDQRPPAYSACKIDGKPAYARARAGEEVVVRMKRVRIDSLECLSYEWPLLNLRITCGRGTYIRSLARQIGTALGTGGYLRSLVRTAVGAYTLADATDLADVPEPLTEEMLIPVELPKK